MSIKTEIVMTFITTSIFINNAVLIISQMNESRLKKCYANYKLVVPVDNCHEDYDIYGE